MKNNFDNLNIDIVVDKDWNHIKGESKGKSMNI